MLKQLEEFKDIKKNKKKTRKKLRVLANGLSSKP
jgi:hypothetical protein